MTSTDGRWPRTTPGADVEQEHPALGAHRLVPSHHAARTGPATTTRPARIAAAAVLTASTAALAGAATGVASADVDHRPSVGAGHQDRVEVRCDDSGGSVADAVSRDVLDDVPWFASSSSSSSVDDGCTTPRSGSDSTDSSADSSTDSSSRASTGSTTPTTHQTSRTTTPATTQRPALNPLDTPPPPGQVRTIKLPATSHR